LKLLEHTTPEPISKMQMAFEGKASADEKAQSRLGRDEQVLFDSADNAALGR